ncbi:hypothetical protein SLEP1_g3938 [Rubroshorea leprosula]|uniref:KIB1-4 beta-propeller domain-containing protein n=1 Tax=Rubroshorea leprosula TaxID=152421 RepID=A0AAV5HM31_9ROSI|nr:hypothetical protein SLEP1_g3938 [Rubroshorea leprosula]
MGQPRTRPTWDCCAKKSRYLLPAHVVESIFKLLPLQDLVRTKALSSFWNSYTQFLLSARFPKAPWLMLPPNRPPTSCRFLNVQDNIEETTSEVFLESHCIGSSQGWLIFLDHSTFSPFLFNPFTNVRIHLPSLTTFYGDEELDFLRRVRYFALRNGAKDPIKHYVQKAILTAEPVGEYSVVMICDFCTAIIFYKNGESCWTELNQRHSYKDVICCQNEIYALDSNNAIHIMSLAAEGRLRESIDHTLKPFLDDCVLSRYIVESEGEILQVINFICCRAHKAKLFQVYKLDSENRRWVEVKSLRDQSLVIGRNHSVSVSTKDMKFCKGNSIYFTNDYWAFVPEANRLPYEYEFGAYTLEDGKISQVFEFDVESLKNEQLLLPCWIVPHSRN